MSELGRLTQVHNLRAQWPDEARDFTPWLAKPNNLKLIGETLGPGEDWLELVEIEASIGRFSADILCQDTSDSSHLVIIENQFGPTDHDHLGKLLTYAAGRDAKTVIWIAERLREEHRAAIDFLNGSTSSEFQFFALEIELWRIGDSLVAPRFNVVAKPNEWSRTFARASRTTAETGLSDLKKQYIRYWSAFKQTLEDSSEIGAQKASPQQWIYMPLGRSNFTLTANVNSRENWIMAQLELHADVAGDYFRLLERDRVAIDAECPFELSWEALPNRKGARIATKRLNTDPTDETTWDVQHQWLVERLTILRTIFRPRVHSLDLDDLDDANPQTLTDDRK